MEAAEAMLLAPTDFAAAGAAAFVGGVTGTVSIAVIVFEMTNQVSYRRLHNCVHNCVHICVHICAGHRHRAASCLLPLSYLLLPTHLCRAPPPRCLLSPVSCL